MKREAKNILKNMIEKSYEADVEKLIDKEKKNIYQQIHDKRVAAFCALIAKNPRKYFCFTDAGNDNSVTDDSEVLSSYLQVDYTNDSIAALKKIEKQFPLPEEEDAGRTIEFVALDFKLFNVSPLLSQKYSKLAEQIDLAVISNDAADLYSIIKKALQ